MQRKRRAGKVDWFFVTCITKNRRGTEYCDGTYIHESDILYAILREIQTINFYLVVGRSIPLSKIANSVENILIDKGRKLNDFTIEAVSPKYEEVADFSMNQYEKYVMDEGLKETIATAQPTKEQAKVDQNRLW